MAKTKIIQYCTFFGQTNDSIGLFHVLQMSRIESFTRATTI